jgi:phthalate 4,5-dioxygenase oxygenase subunit
MGRIADRSRDVLGASDMAIVEFRKLMVEAARQVQQGETAIGTGAGRIPTTRVASFQGIVPKSCDWRVFGAAEQELGAARDDSQQAAR